MSEKEHIICSEKGCSFPQGECVFIDEARKLAEEGNYTPEGWGYTKREFYRLLEKSDCPNAEKSSIELENIQPKIYLPKKVKIG